MFDDHNYKDFAFPVFVPESNRSWRWLTNKDYLPEEPAIYVIHRKEEADALYIGQTSNLKKRWNFEGKQHHVLPKLYKINNNSIFNLRISFCYAEELSNYSFRIETEKRLIKVYNPVLNILDKREVLPDLPHGIVQVTKISKKNKKLTKQEKQQQRKDFIALCLEERKRELLDY